MKKNFFYALMSAIALTSAVGFTACSSDDGAVADNPNYDATTGEVKTAFTLSVGSVAGTRMTADAVQEDLAFNGMTDIYLFPFKSAVTTSNAASTNIEESYIHLADFSGFDAAVLAAQGKIYRDVNLSVGVNNFLFYGATQAPGNGKLKASYLSMTDNTWKEGYTSWAPSPILKGSSTVGELKFDLVPIRRGWTIEDVQGDEGAVATIAPLNAADAAIATQITAAGAATDAGKELVAIQKVLRNVKVVSSSEVYKSYAGSSNSIKNLMQMLYATLKNKAAVLTVDETNYATPILTAIEDYFDADDQTGEWILTWKTDPGFPANLGVPDGAAAVQYDADATPAKFKYVTASVDGLAVPSIANYTYPASLYYRVNSPSMVRNSEYLTTSANANATWADVINNGAYQEGAITALTRSVIIEDQVQYAVGRLDVQVRVKPETIINDNTKDAPQPVTVPNGGYTLTGVLIGGQKQVGWDFKPIESATEMTIWDNVTTGSDPIVAMQQADYSAVNHTLALETKANTNVNIALEFTNTGNDFVGVDNNIIPAGTKFYLVAQLNPAQGKMFDNPEATPTLNSVFTQDYITRVKLTINENSLKSAYNVVPDLRSPKLEFGLSVNLEWQNGLVFEQNF